ncbi:EF-hand calcium-binding domain-containing protein 11 isoform X2 [Pteropus alecto]|uniref:EF-hand calcium-binding domain-containing protein 11 isoform X2 n=1 Tax=Pteropus alecto TaxID=9402 RepID=UPI000D53A6AB|nr:EF-hand calcium-binding domain-containing protein 11 isoform X2 [Pteropus alecto]
MFFSQAGAQPRTGEASPSERKKLVEVFKACDEDNKGYLSREDFKVAVVMLFGYKPSKIEANSVMSSLNPDTSGISLEEFLNFVRKKKELQLYRNEIRHIFTAFDRHYRGYLTLEDFQKAFKQVAPKLPERIILEVFRMKKEVQKPIKRRKKHMSCKVIRYKVKMRKAKMKSECRSQRR